MATNFNFRIVITSIHFIIIIITIIIIIKNNSEKPGNAHQQTERQTERRNLKMDMLSVFLLP